MSKGIVEIPIENYIDVVYDAYVQGFYARVEYSEIPITKEQLLDSLIKKLHETGKVKYETKMDSI